MSKRIFLIYRGLMMLSSLFFVIWPHFVRSSWWLLVMKCADSLARAEERSLFASWFSIPSGSGAHSLFLVDIITGVNRSQARPSRLLTAAVVRPTTERYVRVRKKNFSPNVYPDMPSTKMFVLSHLLRGKNSWIYVRNTLFTSFAN